MRIGLLRHFPVCEALPKGWWTMEELAAWRERYDRVETLLGTADLGGVAWQQCLASDLSRASQTARAVFSGEVQSTPLLREVEFSPFATGRLRLPVWGWKRLMQLAWLTGHPSQRTFRDDFRSRVTAMADRLEALHGDILVVSHAGFMAYLSAELRRRRFIGPKLRLAKHATAYVYERP